MLPVGYSSLKVSPVVFRAEPNVDDSSYTLNSIACNWWAYHLGLSPINKGSNTDVCTLRKTTFLGHSDHSAKYSTAYKEKKIVPLNKSLLKISLHYKDYKFTLNMNKYNNKPMTEM